MGICYNNIGKFDKAVWAFKNIISKEPAHLPLILKLSIAFQNLKMWNKAELICQDVLNIYPNYGNVWFSLGVSLLGQENTLGAVAAFEKALKINPQYKNAHVRLGMAHAYLGNFYDAFFHITLCLESYPKYPDLHYLIGIIYVGCQKFQMAIDSFEQALKLHPSFIDARIKASLLYYKTRRKSNAIVLLKESPDKNEEIIAILDFMTHGKPHRKILTPLGAELISNTIKGLNHHIKIKPHLSEMISIIKTFPEEDTSIYESLIPIISESLKQTPQFADAYCNLGSLYFKLNNYEEAETMFEKAIKINPKYMQARIYYLKVLEKQEKLNDALNEGKFFLENNMQYPDVFCTLGKVYFALDMVKEAEKMIKKALIMNPDYAAAHLTFAKILIYNGEKKKGIIRLQTCLKSEPTKDVKNDAQKILLKINKIIP